MEAAAASGWNSYSINGWQHRYAGICDLAVEPRILDVVCFYSFPQGNDSTHKDRSSAGRVTRAPSRLDER